MAEAESLAGGSRAPSAVCSGAQEIHLIPLGLFQCGEGEEYNRRPESVKRAPQVTLHIREGL